MCPFNTPPVSIQNASACTGTTRTCVSTCARVAGNGDVLNVHTGTFWMDTHGEGRGHRQFCSQKFAHVGLITCPTGSTKKPMDLTHLKFENNSRTTCSPFLRTLALPHGAVELQLPSSPKPSLNSFPRQEKSNSNHVNN